MAAILNGIGSMQRPLRSAVRAPYDAPMPTLNVHRFGPDSGPAVLCLHGVTGHGLRFRRIATETLAGRRVLAVDLRGHGRSSWAPPWRIEDHVDDIVATLDAEGLSSVQVIGHSFGGLLATHLAARAPERISRAVLIDPAIAIDPLQAQQDAESSLLQASWGSPEEARDARRALRPSPAFFPGSDQDVADHLVEGPDGRFRFRHSAAAVVNAWAEMARPPVELGGLDLQLLLLSASQAPYVTDATRAWLRGDLGNRFTEVAIDAGHMLYWDAFDETSAAIAGFLA
jgi:lipase